MSISFFALATLIALMPAFGIMDRLQAVGAVSAILSLALATTAFTLPVDSLRRLRRLLPPVLIAVLAAPALWMVMQVLPMPAHTLANQIWSSASSALNRPLSGSITIDIGATLLSLAQYCAVIATALVTAAVALDRPRAIAVLYILTASATLIAAWQIVIGMGLFLHAPNSDSINTAEAVFIAVAGAALSCGAAFHIYEQLRRTGGLKRAGTTSILGLSASAVAFAICATAILTLGETGSIVATLVGTGTLVAMFLIRRWALGPWGKFGLAATAAVVLFGAMAAIPIKTDSDLAVAWSMQDQTATERMLADVPIVGTGAGAYKALLPIYRDVASNSHPQPTAAAVIIIEMGRPFFGGLVVAALCGAWLLFSRAIVRRQDFVFAGIGAAMLAAAPILIFTSGDIFGPSASLMAGVLGGLAFAQSLSASSRLSQSPLTQMAQFETDRRGSSPPAALQVLNKMWPRYALALMALVLIAQAAWILGAELIEPGRGSLAQDAAPNSAARERIQKAATFAIVRGDLWAKSGWAQIAPRDGAAATGSTSGSGPSSALGDLNRAVRFAPHRSDAWLMLAWLADRDKPSGYDADALLKMSYYTAPNDLTLLPLRLNIALAAEWVTEDTELRDMIQHDVSLILTRQPDLRPALTAAYRSASPARKLIAERLISEVDPGYLMTIRRP